MMGEWGEIYRGTKRKNLRGKMEKMAGEAKINKVSG